MKKTKMLKKNYEFRKVLSKGNYYTGTYIEALIQKEPKGKNYLGIAVSTKVGKAVKRNKIKRLIRESYYKYESNIKNGQSIVILWKKKQGVENATFYNIENDMKKILDKANILIEE
ncbi:MAG: ribonuclease P protein component [Clostridia bacterium]|nr:ribonuclease P protein component [Clostridia bacterium]